MKTTIQFYDEKWSSPIREVATIREAMKTAQYVFDTMLKCTLKSWYPLCIDINTTIGNKTYQYIQVLDGSTLFVASLKSV